jgi:hypothetical protein
MAVEAEWMEAELEAAVAAYMEMLRLERAGTAYSNR